MLPIGIHHFPHHNSEFLISISIMKDDKSLVVPLLVSSKVANNLLPKDRPLAYLLRPLE